jgi:integrase/recombinase XerD
MWAHWGMEISQPGPAVSGVVLTTPRYQHLAVAAYLAHFKGQTRIHTESDLFSYLDWCQVRALDPLLATRPHIELYLRWLQEVRRYRPFTVSRRMSAVAGFYRTCVIDTVLEHSPAEYVRRPNVPPESPTLGLTHLQFEALLTAARLSANRHDLALVATLGLLGLRIFEATGSDIEHLGEEHGHRVLTVTGKARRWSRPPAARRCASHRACYRRSHRWPILLTQRGTRMDRHCDTRRLRRLPKTPGLIFRACTRTCCGTPSSPQCSTLASTCATSRSPPGTPTPAPQCATTA